MIFQSSSLEKTKKFAGEVAARILKTGPQKKGAIVLALYGDLGAGKTTFTQGFFKGLGIKKVPASPTFILMRRSSIQGGLFKNIYHIDAYRVNGHIDFEVLGLKEILADPQNIVLIEWPERIEKILPKTMFKFQLEHGDGLDHRKIKAPAKFKPV